jgi:hypothetical protein
MSDPAPTLTLAGLYERQGLVGTAREMYQRLANEGPAEQRQEAARRLQRLVPPASGSIERLRVLLKRVEERRRRG